MVLLIGRLLQAAAAEQHARFATDSLGYVSLEALRQALSEELGSEVTTDTLRRVVRRARRLELKGDTVRARQRRDPEPPPKTTPDILYHACTAEQARAYQAAGAVRLESRPIFLSDDEAQAWRVAHRLGGEPQVLYVDTARHRRRRLKLQRSRRSGLYMARSLALTDVLNLQPQFEEQRSAGGIPVMLGPDGVWRMALIRVTRRSGVTWEVAKGKLEHGEPPEWAGIREVQEEMGVDVGFEVRALVGLVRYGFLAPGGLPRLKTIHLYLLEPQGDMLGAFRPAEKEGIRDVRWFTAAEAVEVVTHTSLRPLMRRARELVEG
jgi:RNA:NAD 2'-phosphotransferase (TPT1/KptA family)/8-oxo-dGTP pyrophosphatase MutT (NUDIX family)